MAQRPFFFAAICFLILGWGAVALGFNMPFTWWAHQTAHPRLDDFFIHFSWLAEWAIIVVAISIALIRDWKRGAWTGSILGIQALVVAGIKSALNAPRPIEINPSLVRLIPNLEMHHWQAFPSGHTAVAFFTMGWMAANYPQSYKHPKAVGVVLFFFAAGIGYSRMYLAQHSLVDVCAGATIALISLSVANLVIKKQSPHE